VLLLIKTMLLGFYHLSEHVHAAAQCCLGEVPEAKNWAVTPVVATTPVVVPAASVASPAAVPAATTPVMAPVPATTNSTGPAAAPTGQATSFVAVPTVAAVQPLVVTLPASGFRRSVPALVKTGHPVNLDFVPVRAVKAAPKAAPTATPVRTTGVSSPTLPPTQAILLTPFAVLDAITEEGVLNESKLLGFSTREKILRTSISRFRALL
jgi:hypothetical protein